MVFYRRFDFSLLNTNIPLGDSCAAVLKQILYQSNVVPVIPVNFRSIVLPEAVGADSGNVQVIAYDLQLLLDSPLRNRENDISGANAIVQAIAANKLVQRKSSM